MSIDSKGDKPTVDADEGNLLRTVRNLWEYMWPPAALT